MGERNQEGSEKRTTKDGREERGERREERGERREESRRIGKPNQERLVKGIKKNRGTDTRRIGARNEEG
jgi:hypothetical protein